MPLPPREVIQQVAEASDIVDVIGEYFPLQRAGGEFKALSPFTNEKTPSFYVNPAKQFFHCFSSNTGGDVFKFVQSYENISFGEALKKLADRAGIVIAEMELTPEMIAEQRLKMEAREILRQTRDWYHRLLLRSPAAAPARDYLKERGINSEVAKNWKLGYAPENSQVTVDWARECGFKRNALLASGVLRQSQRGSGVYAHFRHRLMFPINNDVGDPIAFSGRVLSADQKGGKYVNSPDGIVFHKSNHFFGLDRSKRAIISAKRSILCEGQMDVIAVYEAGFENVVASLGTAFTERHASLLRRQAPEVVICYDADRAGIKAADGVFTEMARAGGVVKVARMPEGEDPDSMIKAQGVEAFQKVLDEAEDYFDFQINAKLPNPAAAGLAERAELARELAEKLGLIDDVMQRDMRAEKIAARLGVGAEELRRETELAVRKEVWDARRGKKKADKDAAPILSTGNKVLRDLSRALAMSSEAREWIQENAEREFLDEVSDSAIVKILWDGDFDPDEPSTFSAFLAPLADEVNNAITRILAEDAPTPTAATAEQCWRALQREHFHRLIDALETRMKDGTLPKEQQEAMWKDWFDLQERLKNIPAPEIPPEAD